MILLSDQIQEFIDWLKEMTEFGDWNERIQIEVHKKLIECMISVPIAAPPAPTAKLSELKQKVATMRIAAQERIRDDAWRWPHVQPNVLESVIGAIGEISVVEAREALARLESEAAPPERGEG